MRDGDGFGGSGIGCGTVGRSKISGTSDWDFCAEGQALAKRTTGILTSMTGRSSADRIGGEQRASGRRLSVITVILVFFLETEGEGGESCTSGFCVSIAWARSNWGGGGLARYVSSIV